MPSKIKRLASDVINKIAAGEVVENPSSVVKELVENSLDAGATEIVVEIRGGGRQLIKITDNGSGMGREDAELALERHATSKIQEASDLNALHTMGFRGEALASIASISKLSLLTRQEDEPVDAGTLVVVEGGCMKQCAKAARARGTTIEIGSLFYNVPVRKKFLKSPAQDGADITRVLSIMALGYPEVSFHLIRDGKSVLKATAGEGSFMEQLKLRIALVYGEEFLEAALPLEHHNIAGFVGNPSYTRANRLGQTLFINRRAVVSPVVSRAVKEGFGTTIAPQRYPAFVLHWTMPAFDVDVNVHPQKKEVRLRDEEGVIATMRDAVCRALQPKPLRRAPLAPSFSKPAAPEPLSSPVVKESAVTYVTSVEEPVQVEIEWQPETFSPAVIGTIKGYIFTEPEGGDGCLVIDQRRAHHRVLFEKLKKKNGQAPSQWLSSPLTIDLSPMEAESMAGHASKLRELGFSLREFSGRSLIVDALPQGFSTTRPEHVIKTILEDLQTYPHATDGVRDQELRRISLRGALSSEVRLSRLEAEQLVKQLWNGSNKDQCPSGKKIWAHLCREKIADHL